MSPELSPPREPADSVGDGDPELSWAQASARRGSMSPTPARHRGTFVPRLATFDHLDAHEVTAEAEAIREGKGAVYDADQKPVAAAGESRREVHFNARDYNCSRAKQYRCVRVCVRGGGG